VIPEYQETELYYFDEEAADRACRFIEKYCRHFEGRHAGKQFLLIPWEKQLVRTLFGWKRKDDKTRRFRTLFLLTAKGAGKTPLFGACGLYALIGDKEASPHVISMASTSEQARFTFDAAKMYIHQDLDLQRFASVKQHEIRGIRNGGKWTTISGSPKGRSGGKPSCIIADEMMEWAGPTAEAFELLTANAFKRAQPLILIATNAGDSLTSYAYQQYERACRVRDGEIQDDTLLPVIFETPEEMDWQSEQAASIANPSMGSIVSFAALKPALVKAQESPEGESKYRRLYLSQWPKTSVGRWLDLGLWDKCTKEFDPAALTDAVLYDGADLSLCNDLSAALFIFAMPEKFYVDAHFWMPRVVAEEHQAKHSVPYLEWEKGGHITLVDSPTIDPATRLAISAYVAAKTGKHKLKAVCYDAWKADAVIASLEGAGITCVPIRQGASLFPGCEELDRRLQEGSIQFSPNPVMRFCAENAQIKSLGGAYWPVKPNAKGTYAGTRWRKIDGISALVTALVEARKHAFPNARKMWQGSVSVVSPPGKGDAGKSPVPGHRVARHRLGR
jgi:phage terminase large subunit-like protein